MNVRSLRRMSTYRPLPISPDQHDEVLDELAKLKEEVVNTRHVVIKTDNLIKNLSSEVKYINQKQVSQERKSLFNSAIAYIIFVLLIFGGLYLSFQAKIERHQTELDLVERDVESKMREIKDLNVELRRWKQIEQELLRFEHLVREGEKEKAVKHFSTLRQVRFSGLLEELILKFKSEVAQEKYQGGVKSYKQGSYSKSDELFKASIAYNEDPPYLGDLLYFQGMATMKLEDYPRAAELLKKAQSFQHSRKVRVDIAYYLAWCHDQMGQKDTARKLYYRFYLRYRSSETHRAARAKRRYESLDKQK